MPKDCGSFCNVAVLLGVTFPLSCRFLLFVSFNLFLGPRRARSLIGTLLYLARWCLRCVLGPFECGDFLSWPQRHKRPPITAPPTAIMSDARFEKTAIAESEVTTLNPKADEATAFNSTPGSEHASDDKLEIQRRHSAVRDLARQFTQTSGIDVQDNPSKLFHHDDPESPLNPNGNCFNARIWAKTLAKLTESTSNGFRRSGFAFQHMNVHGYGSATGYQKDVANVLLEIPNLATRLLRGSDSQHRIDILRDFDGVVNSGEMLVVLGPPGSGCSTFLKSIAGETNGLHVDKSSYINYNGITAKEMRLLTEGLAEFKRIGRA